MPTVSTHLPDNSPYIAKLDARAPDDVRGARSDYLRKLIERDLDNVPADVDALRPDVMIFLIQELSGKLDAGRMAKIIGDQHQPTLLRNVLLDFVRYSEMEMLHSKAAEEPKPALDPEKVGRSAAVAKLAKSKQ